MKNKKIVNGFSLLCFASLFNLSAMEKETSVVAENNSNPNFEILENLNLEEPSALAQWISANKKEICIAVGGVTVVASGLGAGYFLGVRGKVNGDDAKKLEDKNKILQDDSEKLKTAKVALEKEVDAKQKAILALNAQLQQLQNIEAEKNKLEVELKAAKEGGNQEAVEAQKKEIEKLQNQIQEEGKNFKQAYGELEQKLQEVSLSAGIVSQQDLGQFDAKVENIKQDLNQRLKELESIYSVEQLKQREAELTAKYEKIGQEAPSKGQQKRATRAKKAVDNIAEVLQDPAKYFGLEKDKLAQDAYVEIDRAYRDCSAKMENTSIEMLKAKKDPLLDDYIARIEQQ